MNLPTSIAECWRIFQEGGLAGNLDNPEMRERVRRVFYCGAAATVSLLVLQGLDHDKVLEEIRAFKKEMRP